MFEASADMNAKRWSLELQQRLIDDDYVVDMFPSGHQGWRISKGEAATYFIPFSSLRDFTDDDEEWGFIEDIVDTYDNGGEITNKIHIPVSGWPRNYEELKSLLDSRLAISLLYLIKCTRLNVNETLSYESNASSFFNNDTAIFADYLLGFRFKAYAVHVTRGKVVNKTAYDGLKEKMKHTGFDLCEETIDGKVLYMLFRTMRPVEKKI